MKVLQINTVYSQGSTGMIMKEISDLIVRSGNESFIACGYGKKISDNEYVINNTLEKKINVAKGHIFGLNGFYNQIETRRFIKWVEHIDPDIIHIHNIHGHYLNSEMLFDYIASHNKKVVWTLHDCWPFTGHCAHFDAIGCEKWKTGCYDCQNLRGYPNSIFIDRSKEIWKRKNELFNLPAKENMIFAATSDWVRKIQSQSFLSEYPCVTINNGVDLSMFCEKKDEQFRNYFCKPDDFLIFGSTDKWFDERNEEVVDYLDSYLPPDIKILLAGKPKSKHATYDRIKTIPYIKDREYIVKCYSAADIYFNMTYEDTFPTVNIESLACGTPVITNNVCGSGEIIDDTCGIKVEKDNAVEAFNAIMSIYNDRNRLPRAKCRERAEQHYDKNVCFEKYLDLYKKVL